MIGARCTQNCRRGFGRHLYANVRDNRCHHGLGYGDEMMCQQQQQQQQQQQYPNVTNGPRNVLVSVSLPFPSQTLWRRSGTRTLPAWALPFWPIPWQVEAETRTACDDRDGGMVISSGIDKQVGSESGEESFADPYPFCCLSANFLYTVYCSIRIIHQRRLHHSFAQAR